MEDPGMSGIFNLKPERKMQSQKQKFNLNLILNFTKRFSISSLNNGKILKITQM